MFFIFCVCRVSFADLEEELDIVCYLTLLDIVHHSSPSYLSPDYLMQHTGHNTQVIDTCISYYKSLFKS